MFVKKKPSKKKQVPRGFKPSKQKGKPPKKSKTPGAPFPGTRLPPETLRPKPSLHECLGASFSDDLRFFLIELKSPKDKSPAFSFELWSAPRTISWQKKTQLNEPKTQGNTQQPIGFQYLDNRRLTLSEVTFDGKTRGQLPTEVLKNISYMQEPGPRSKLKVFKLIVKLSSTGLEANSYGNFVILPGTIREVFRDERTGKSLRIVVDFELIEVADYQLDFGQDLSIPKSIIPTLPPELSAQESGSGAPGDGASSGPIGKTLPAGTRVAFSGSTGVGSGPHLHLIYHPFGGSRVAYNQVDIDKYHTNARFGGSNRSYPNFVLEAFTGTLNGKDLLLKQIPISSRVGPRDLNIPGSSKWHKGMDFATPMGTELKLAYPMEYLGRLDFRTSSGNFTGYGRTATFLCNEPGKAGVYVLCHLNAVDANLQVNAAKSAEAEKTAKSVPAVAPQKKQSSASNKPRTPRRSLDISKITFDADKGQVQQN
jgi:hypothetical protein